MNRKPYDISHSPLPSLEPWEHWATLPGLNTPDASRWGV